MYIKFYIMLLILQKTMAPPRKPRNVEDNKIAGGDVSNEYALWQY